MARKDHSQSKSREAVTRRILTTLEDYPVCDLERLISLCPDLTWSEVFLELHRLNHKERIHLSLQGLGNCTIHLLPQESPHAPSTLNERPKHVESVQEGVSRLS